MRNVENLSLESVSESIKNTGARLSEEYSADVNSVLRNEKPKNFIRRSYEKMKNFFKDQVFGVMRFLGIKKDVDPWENAAVEVSIGQEEKEKIKNNFSEKIETDLMVDKFLQSDGDLSVEIFDRKLAKNLDFKVCKERSGEKILFQILKDETVKIGELIFEKKGENWSMQHRFVKSQGFGISGTSLLSQSEDILRAFEEKNAIECLNLEISSGQKSVIEWGLKNGYEFENEEMAKKFESVLSGNSDYVCGVSIIDKHDGIKKDDWIVSKENYKKIPKNLKIDRDKIKEEFILKKSLKKTNDDELPMST